MKFSFPGGVPIFLPFWESFKTNSKNFLRFQINLVRKIDKNITPIFVFIFLIEKNDI